jgi:methyltransferase (TIGR00027 family)
MGGGAPLIRSISDTALWSAVHRARESERGDALFRDPFARRLAGPRGEEIAQTLSMGGPDSWSWATRTILYDEFIRDSINHGADTVVNLAAGLDARPYRMAFPPSLQWVEVDLPDILAYKEATLAHEKPSCSVERVSLDLSDVGARRELFGKLGEKAKYALIMTEGLLIYLSPEEVASLARDLAEPSSFRRWAVDLASPGLLELIQRKANPKLEEAGVPLKFGPKEGPGFFEPYGWNAVEVRSMLKTAAHLKRLSFLMRLVSLLPESKGAQGSRPWGGVCLLEKR